MVSEDSTGFTAATVNLFSAAHVATILRERGWLDTAVTSEAQGPSERNAFSARLMPGPDRTSVPPGDVDGPAWLDCAHHKSARAGDNEQGLDRWLGEAAALLGPHAASRDALADLLSLVFEYDAHAILRHPESHIVLAREGAREVIRELAHQVLEGPPVDSDHFKEIVSALKERLRHRGRQLFHPIRLALAGRAGEGELDRVILLLDCTTALPFRVAVKGTRQRMLEFCASME